ncbi:hypothetical protein GCM10022243_01630 [Saccharothrix violaceirubra]|uniref:DUF1707 domain-containing protein n=1 Tax=Saccharothrix violaceirubra TaxID=413306 RepID=A0A7W7T3I8_9PSEU|nr:DUF1707 domain-containing protein [Saccharothrix violaceirubra]MBB4965920.1 hypothetical protein [Saccharothrix violaceirubra]
MTTPVRASDTERDQVAARLRDAVGEGRLTLTEADERLSAAYAAVHRDDLDTLVADLPGPPPAPPRRRPPIGAVAAFAVAFAVVGWVAGPPFPLLVVLAFVLVRRRAGKPGSALGFGHGPHRRVLRGRRAPGRTGALGHRGRP